MRTFLFKILTSKEFENYCREERGWKTIGTVKSSGQERLKIVRGELPDVHVHYARMDLLPGYTIEAVNVEGCSSYKKTFYRYDRNPHRPWAIDVYIDVINGPFRCKYETFDDVAKKIQKVWHRRRATLTIQRWWKSIYYAPERGSGYFLARSSYINKL